MRNWLVALGLLVAAPALGAVALQQSVESLARGSDAVVRGTVQKRGAHREGGRIYTDVEVRVSEVWRGSAPARVTVSVPGGALNGIGQWVPGAPTFTDAEDVALFLTRTATGRYGVTGLSLGKFSLAGQSARPNLAGMETLPQPLAAGERATEAMPLAELKRRVQGAR